MMKYLFFSLLLVQLSACGFHLADQGEFSPQLNHTYVQAPTINKQLVQSIEKNIRANGLNVAASEEATAILHVLNEEKEKSVLTLDNDGKVREYELLLKVDFEVRGSDKNILLNKQSIELSRDFVFDKSDLLGANEEEQDLFNEMRNDVARLIIYRLQTI